MGTRLEMVDGRLVVDGGRVHAPQLLDEDAWAAWGELSELAAEQGDSVQLVVMLWSHDHGAHGERRSETLEVTVWSAERARRFRGTTIREALEAYRHDAAPHSAAALALAEVPC